MFGWLRRRRPRRAWLDVWERFARSRGGSFRLRKLQEIPAVAPAVGKGWQYVRRRAVELPVVEIPAGAITITMHAIRSEKAGFTTVFGAPFEVGAGPRFELVPHDFAVLRLAVARSIDDLFELRGEAELARVCMSASDAKRLVDDVHQPHIDSNGEAIGLITAGFCHDEVAIATVIDQLAAIACSDGLGLRVLRTLRDADWVARDPMTELPAIELSLPERIRIGPVRGGGVRTRASTSIAVVRQAAVAVDAAGALRVSEGDPVSSTIAAACRAAGEGALRCDDGEVSFVWPGIVRDRDRLTAGARAIAEFAREATGSIYR